MNIDPVCGMEVEPDDAEASSSFNGQQVYFCSIECKHEFDRHPEQYAKNVA